MAATTTFTKLRSGDWGVRTVDTDRLDRGVQLEVTKKSGETTTVVVDKVIWRDGSVALCTIGGETKRPATRPCTCGLHRSWRRCRTDGNCSSFGDGRNCGGCDCDGF